MAHEEAHHGHHITPKPLLYKVFGALVALTVFTVLSAQVDLGVMNVPLAIAIATTKATLVVLFFMALKYDNRVNSLVFSVGTLFVVIFIVFTLFDTAWRGEIGGVDAETITDQLRDQEVHVDAEEGGAPPFETGGETPREPIENIEGQGGGPAGTRSDDVEGELVDTTTIGIDRDQPVFGQ